MVQDLYERTLCVSYNNSTLIFLDVKYGVLQGFALGHLFFSLYISSSMQCNPFTELISTAMLMILYVQCMCL